jgi:hypothetical protein
MLFEGVTQQKIPQNNKSHKNFPKAGKKQQINRKHVTPGLSKLKFHKISSKCTHKHLSKKTHQNIQSAKFLHCLIDQPLLNLLVFNWTLNFVNVRVWNAFAFQQVECFLNKNE